MGKFSTKMATRHVEYANICEHTGIVLLSVPFLLLPKLKVVQNCFTHLKPATILPADEQVESDSRGIFTYVIISHLIYVQSIL